MKNKIFVEINLSHSKQTDTKSSAEWHLWAFTGHLNSIYPYSGSIFNFLTFLFLYLNGCIQSPDAKRAQIIVVIIIIIIINIIIIVVIIIIIIIIIMIIIIIIIINTLFQIGKLYIALQKFTV